MSVETTQVRIGLIDPTKEVFNQETGDTVIGKGRPAPASD